MVLFTDIGKDIDDAIALVYAILTDIPIKDIVCTSKDVKDSASICQNIINILSVKKPKCKSIKVLMGSTEPKRNGIIHSNIYLGPFSRGDFKFDKYDPKKIKKDEVISIGPLTDLFDYLKTTGAKKILFMGQARKDGETLLPDLEAYNFKCDPYASQACFQFQETIPFALVGKNIAYKVPLTFEDVDSISTLNSPIAKFLRDHAYMSFDFFKNNAPEVYERAYRGTTNISYCYDPLCMLTVTNPELFSYEKFGAHRIAVNIKAEKAKEILMKVLKDGLS